MATISDLVGELESNYLHRADLTTFLTQACRNFYRVLCSKVPFEELQERTNINTIANDPLLDTSTLKLAGIMSVRINWSATQAVRLKRSHTRLMDNRPTPLSGRPHSYARFNKKLELDPPPDAVYTTNVRYWKTADIDSTPGNTVIVAPDAWHELIIWETYYRALIVLNRHAEAQNLIITAMQPKMPSPKKNIQQDLGIIPRLWNELLATIQEREHIDEEYGINPITRL